MTCHLGTATNALEGISYWIWLHVRVIVTRKTQSRSQVTQSKITLPLDAPVWHWPNFLSEQEANRLFKRILQDYDVTNKMIPMADGSLFEGQTGNFMFCAPELTHEECLPPVWGKRAPWFTELLVIKQQIEALLDTKFQVARCIYYQDGNEGVDFHRDLAAYGPTDKIASLSLGATRVFSLRDCNEITKQIDITLKSGSLLFMGPGCQEQYQHSLIMDPDCHQPRINLTFRKFNT